MGSSRFPGKTLEDLCGKTLLERVLSRVSAASRIDELVVATTSQPGDDPVADAAAEAGVAVFRGSVDDVLDRYVRAAREHAADIVVRNTADEPFADPALIDEVRRLLDGHEADYASNNIVHVYPEGVDTEAMPMASLETAWREATRPSDREHVTPFLWRQPERFRCVGVQRDPVEPELRLTVDYPADLEFARALYRELPDAFTLNDIIDLLTERPDLRALCPVVPRREGYDRSVREE
jgi:spore coat polysaccharide biosynthesis protein SpsF (cytidylyltransferase family)